MSYPDIYESREAAGKILADKLQELNLNKPYLLAIPRGGIQVAEGIADRFKIPIHPLIVKKLPIPGSPETAFGAITEEGVRVLDVETVSYLELTKEIIDRISDKVKADIRHRIETYGGLNKEEIRSSDAIITDDGVATGYSLIAAIKSVKNYEPNSVTVAIPVSSKSAYERIRSLVNTVVCPIISDTPFFAVGNFYEEWYDLNEEQIKRIIKDYMEKYKAK